MSYYNWQSKEHKENVIEPKAVDSLMQSAIESSQLKTEICRLNERIVDLNKQIQELHSAGDALVDIIDNESSDVWLPKWERDALAKWLEAKRLKQ